MVIWEPLKDWDGKVDTLKDAKRDEAFWLVLTPCISIDRHALERNTGGFGVHLKDAFSHSCWTSAAGVLSIIDYLHP